MAADIECTVPGTEQMLGIEGWESYLWEDKWFSAPMQGPAAAVGGGMALCIHHQGHRLPKHLGETKGSSFSPQPLSRMENLPSLEWALSENVFL